MVALLKDSHLQVFDLAKAFNFVNTPSSANLKQALTDLNEVQGSALIIGGIAVGYHGFERTTKDIDIIYKNRDTGILNRLGKYFDVVRSAESGWHELKHKTTGVVLELIPEGGLGQYGFIPLLDTLGGQDGYISLHGLLWLKLIAGRDQDQTDVVRLYKCKPMEVAAARAQLPTEFHERFDALVTKAQHELDNDPYLHPEKFMKRMMPDGSIVDLSKKKP